MKRCSACNTQKDESMFGINRKSHTGLTWHCRECINSKTRKRRKENPTQWEKQRDKNFINRREKMGIDPSIRLIAKKGEGYISRDGYKSFKRTGHPCADKNGRCQASHLVIYENLGKVIQKGESVHHKNGDRLDNRIENLEIWTTSQPPGQRVEDKITWAVEFLTQYGYTVSKE
ncbi:MAG: HNH endonuclease [Bacteroidota bacterium]